MAMNKAIVVEISDRYERYPVDEPALIDAVSSVIVDSDFLEAEISLTLVDDEEMQVLNAQYLDHDYPTDVLSFPLSDQEDVLIGEIIVSIDTAKNQAKEHGVSTEQELTLYAIHGALHLVEYDDKQESNRLVMRDREKYYMEKAGMASNTGSETGKD